jgi:hypothetical protein
VPSLPVDLNRDRLHGVEAPNDFRTDGPFEVELRNLGEAVHVHLHLDDDLASVASLSDGNHYVERDAMLAVPVSTAPVDRETRGRLKVVSGYGAEEQYVSVTVSPNEDDAKPTVDVDESLGKPAQRAESEPAPVVDIEELRTPLVVGGLLVLIALFAAGLIVDQGLLLLAVGILVGGVVVGLITRLS